ncbi:hypothetical protein [Methylobacterium durans]|uniref:hypothetical protein n=1 Tax=Methylobacterium durans TaxID=2202825 RepID=UPI001F32681B|nr:hypothetical protein [Methylobacterium durans]
MLVIRPGRVIVAGVVMPLMAVIRVVAAFTVVPRVITACVIMSLVAVIRVIVASAVAVRGPIRGGRAAEAGEDRRGGVAEGGREIGRDEARRDARGEGGRNREDAKHG